MGATSPVYDIASAASNGIGNFLQSAGPAATSGLNKLSSWLPSSYNGPGGPRIGGNPINIIKNYKWTLSNITNFIDEIPAIYLTEFKCNESVIKRQLNLYTRVIGDTISNVSSLFKKTSNNKYSTVEDVYKNVWPTDNPTGFIYTFPYFNPNAFNLQTTEWKALDAIGDSLRNFVSNIPLVGSSIAKLASIADKAADLAMMAKYPSVGVVDRPRLFSSHNNRTIVISFPLYNTVGVNDWVLHREFVRVLMSQNLFYKRDYVTGIPPVFYQVSVPNQYFSYASCLTDITVKNLGNVRKIENEIVPDAYQVELTLTELVMPSQNQFDKAMETAKVSGLNSISNFL